MPVNGPTVADLTGGLTAERPAMGLVREAAFLSFDDSPVRVAVRLLLRHKAIEAPVRGTVGRSGTEWDGLVRPVRNETTRTSGRQSRLDVVALVVYALMCFQVSQK